MASLPVVSGREVVRRLEKVGLVFVRQKGSHMILRRRRLPRMTVSVPDHMELKNLLRQVGLSVAEFERLK